MKRLVAFMTALILCLVMLPSCSVGGNDSVLTINDETELDTELFTYFLNEAYYGKTEMTDSECIEYATSECLKYAAVNTQFAKTGRTLSLDEKADISTEVNALWRYYGDYLTEIGVSKDTYFKIKQYEVCKENLRFSLYDTDGTNPISEEYIKQYFASAYVGIKYFYQELYDVVSDSELAKMSADEKTAYAAKKQAAHERYNEISSIANYVNSGVYNMDEAFMAVTGQVSADISVSATVVGRNDTSFSPEFIDAVFKQSVGSAFIITNNDNSYIYFIERVNLLSDEFDFYSQYRDKCLTDVSESYFINEINSWVQSYSAVRHLSVAKRCLKKVQKVDRSKYVGAEGYVFNSFQIG